MAASPGSFTASTFAWGMAIPSPMAVLPKASLASMPSLYPAVSLSLPPASIRDTSLSMASSLSETFTPSSMLSFFNNSVIRINAPLLTD